MSMREISQGRLKRLRSEGFRAHAWRMKDTNTVTARRASDAAVHVGITPSMPEQKSWIATPCGLAMTPFRCGQSASDAAVQNY